MGLEEDLSPKEEIRQKILAYVGEDYPLLGYLVDLEDAIRTEVIGLPHPGENHEFRTTCLRCGERGIVNLSIITENERVRVEEMQKDWSVLKT